MYAFLGPNISPPNGTFEDDVSLPKVEYVIVSRKVHVRQRHAICGIVPFVTNHLSWEMFQGSLWIRSSTAHSTSIPNKDKRMSGSYNVRKQNMPFHMEKHHLSEAKSGCFFMTCRCMTSICFKKPPGFQKQFSPIGKSFLPRRPRVLPPSWWPSSYELLRIRQCGRLQDVGFVVEHSKTKIWLFWNGCVVKTSIVYIYMIYNI